MSAKRIHAVKTSSLLVCGEGPDDETVAKFVGMMFARRHSIKYENAGGGSPRDVALAAIKHEAFSVATHCVLLVDSDRGESDMGQLEACIKDYPKINVLIASPRLENMLMDWLRTCGYKVPNNYRTLNSGDSKVALKRVLGDITIHNLSNKFNEDALINISANCDWLSQLIIFLKNAI